MHRVYVDETKAKGYVLVASALHPAECAVVRGHVRRLILPGQPRLHMKAEKTPRQHLVLSTLVGLGVRATVYEADARTHRTDIERRRACLAGLIADVAMTCEHLVLESDASQDARDRRDLVELVRDAGCRDTLRYEHRTAAAEPLLSIPDAVAWAWARGGDWRRRVAPLVERVVAV